MRKRVPMLAPGEALDQTIEAARTAPQSSRTHGTLHLQMLEGTASQTAAARPPGLGNILVKPLPARSGMARSGEEIPG